MAHHFHPEDEEAGDNQSTIGRVSLAGIIKFQSNRQNITDHWNSLHASNLQEYQDGDGAAGYPSTTIDGLPSSSIFEMNPPKLPQIQSVLELKDTTIAQHLGASIISTNALGTLAEHNKAEVNKHDLNSSSPIDDNQYEELFGKLSDSIRLHEQTGEFHGQVVFIAHPHGDISAHQWSSTIYQWVNIGRYAHSRGRVEGSLASDRLKEHGVSHSPLRFFKLAAENREKLMVGYCRPKEAPFVVQQPPPAEDGWMEPLPMDSNLKGESFPVCPFEGDFLRLVSREETKPITPAALHPTIKKEYLEDPFVGPLRSSYFHVVPVHDQKNDVVDSKGSLDFDYKLPYKSTASTASLLDRDTGSTSRELYKLLYHDPTLKDSMSQQSVGNTAFGEDARCSVASSIRYSSLPQVTAFQSSLDATRDGQKPRSKLAGLGDQTRRLSWSNQERILIPEYTHHQPTARSLFPPPGLTVANPHRVISNIDTATLRHVSMQAPAPCSEDLGPEATIVNVNTTALDFSDPDGQGQTQEPEIANGLGQQPPTPQNFKGPFFEDSKPTSSDPTVSLSIRIDAEEKLSNWFRDGYRPARQLEYAKTLISAVAPTNPTQTFGVIGESFYVHKDNHYENTPPFVRLYEGLSEYIEEHRNGSGQSYFTRAWKAAPLQLRDVGMDGNNSYFNSATLAISSSMVRTAAEPPWSTINPLTF